MGYGSLYIGKLLGYTNNKRLILVILIELIEIRCAFSMIYNCAIKQIAGWELPVNSQLGMCTLW